MKIKQLYSTVVFIAAAWMLCAIAYVADMLHGELLMLVVAAVATLSVVIALSVAATVAAHWIVKEQRVELRQQRAEQAAHSARMQEVGGQFKACVNDHMRAIREEVLGIYGAGMQHDRMATVRADNTSRWGRDDLGTGPRPIYEG